MKLGAPLLLAHPHLDLQWELEEAETATINYEEY